MRVISLSPSTTEILFALGAGKDIVANTLYCDYPEEAKKIPKIGSWIRINFEKITALKPDVIFTSTIVQQKLFSQLQEKGFNVFHTDPRSLKDIYQSILDIGKIVHKEQIAVTVTNKMQEEERQFRKSLPKKKLRVYIEEWFSPPMISGNWVPDVVRLAGGEYGIIKQGEMSRKVSLKEVAAYDPDIMLFSYCGFGEHSNLNHLTNRQEWNVLRAVKEKKYFVIDEGILNRPGPRILQAVYEIRDKFKVV